MLRLKSLIIIVTVGHLLLLLLLAIAGCFLSATWWDTYNQRSQKGHTGEKLLQAHKKPAFWECSLLRFTVFILIFGDSCLHYRNPFFAFLYGMFVLLAVFVSSFQFLYFGGVAKLVLLVRRCLWYISKEGEYLPKDMTLSRLYTIHYTNC